MARYPVKVAYYGKDRYKRPPHYKYEPRKPAISQFSEGSKGLKREREEADMFLLGLANMQNLDPWPAILREYSMQALGSPAPVV